MAAMPLPRPNAYPERWAEPVERILIPYCTGVVRFYDPTGANDLDSFPSEDPSYDPFTDEGGHVGPTFLFQSEAIVQTIRTALEIPSETQWATSRAVRVQIPMKATTMLLRKGLILRVMSGAEDPSLEKISMTILGGVNSTHGGMRIIEAVSELAEVPPIEDAP